jgi:hypothetical protein
MKVRPRHSSRRANQSYFLSARDSISLGHQRATQMEVSGDNSIAVVDVHHIPGEKESVYKSNDSTIRCHDRRSRSSAKIHAEVSR